MSGTFTYDTRPAWRVIKAMHAELTRQAAVRGDPAPEALDFTGSCSLGLAKVDLAALADATERALRGMAR